MDITSCHMCPRECGADRTRQRGSCGAGNRVELARAALHFWEEPCISGSRGSGTVFFSHCPLGCCYCQNFEISAKGAGKEVGVERLAQIFIELQAQGAHNINLVNPTHYAAWIIEALDLIRGKLHIPVVYNSGGYDKTDTVRALDGYIDIYLPDFKYRDRQMSQNYSSALDYFERASAAILAMGEQVGKPVFDKDGMLRRGLIVRHMILPGGYRDSLSIFAWLRENLEPDALLVSLMNQYTPCYRSGEFAQLNRRLTTFEYQKVAERVVQWGFRGYFQRRDSAKMHYTPDFDLTGV